MSIKFVSLPHDDVSGGIDALSPEDSIQPGYSEQLVNFDPTPEGSLKKRTGFQSEAGWLPMRVRQVRHLASSDQIELSLDSSIDLQQARAVWVNGLLPATPPPPEGPGSGTEAGQVSYYEMNPIVDPTLEWTGSPLVYEAGSSNLSTDLAWVQVLRQTTPNTREWELVLPDSLKLNPTSKDIEVEAQGIPPSTRLFLPLLNLETSGRDYYRSTPFSMDPGEGTYTVLASAHEIPASSLQFQLVDSTSGEQLVSGDRLSLSSRVEVSGDLVIEWDNPSGSPVSAYVSILSAPSANEIQGTAGPNPGTVRVELPNAAFPFVSCYLEEAGVRTVVYPDSIVRTDSDGVVVEFQADPSLGSKFFVIWTEGQIQSNRLLIPSAVSLTDWSSSDFGECEVCVWGIPHTGSYLPTASARAGWVNELDAYKGPASSHLVAGLGGLLFKQDPTKGPSAAVSLSGQVSSEAILSPAFASEDLGRTRGNIVTRVASESGQVPVLSHVSMGAGVVEFTLGTPAATGTLSSPELDRLTIEGASWPELDGEHSILSVIQTPDTLLVTCFVEGFEATGLGPVTDDQASGALASILTDSIPVVSPKFIVGDRLSSQEQKDTASGLPLTVVGATLSAVQVTGVTERLQMGVSLRLSGTRTSALVPVTHSKEFVGGDSLRVNGLTRKPQVKRVLGWSSIVGGLLDKTLTLTAPIPTSIAVGDMVVLTQAGPLSGPHTVEAIDLTSSSIQLDLPNSVPSFTVCTLEGGLIELDEELELLHSNEVVVDARWMPVEIPASNPPQFSYFNGEYTDQQVVRSTQVNDTLFLNDSVTHPLKYDGDHVYSTGLPRWQAGLFTSLEYPGSIILNARQVIASGKHPDVNNGLKVTTGTGNALGVGTNVTLSWAGATDAEKQEVYPIVSFSEDSSHDIVFLGKSLPTGVGPSTVVTITESTIFWSYYLRLNFIDVNLNVVGSAATGIGDLVVKPKGSESSVTVHIRALGLPDLGIRDWDRMEVQLYRTKQGTAAPYYLVQTLPISKDTTYVDFVDRLGDQFLVDLDPVHSALKGQELGTAWAPAPRASRVTSLGNRLVVANLQRDPYIELALVPNGDVVKSSDLNGLTLAWTGVTGSQVATEFVTTAPVAVTTVTPSSLITLASAHGVADGTSGWIYLSQPNKSNLSGRLLQGWWPCVYVAPDQVQLQQVPTPISSGYTSGHLQASRTSTGTQVPVYLGVDWNYQDSSSTFFNDNILDAPAEGVAARRLANALNAVGVLDPDSKLGIAEAGDGFQKGQLILSYPGETGPRVIPSAVGPKLNIYAFGVLSTGPIESRSTLYGSRLLISYPNFAEVFDNPYSDVDSYSDSAIDVNPADGQEIQAIIPFFGESAFGAALRDSVLLVFKTESIYLVNLAAKVQGQNPVQKLESNGLGCAYPNSVSSVLGGVMFANEAGIYRLGQDLTPNYIGRMVQRIWREQVTPSLDSRDVVFGHNWASKSQYLLSTPETTLVYNSTREGSARAQNAPGGAGGSWTTYGGPVVDSSLGFVALGGMSYMATTSGEVLVRREAGDETDYRDKDQAIEAAATLRAMDFGDEALRKTVPYVVLSFRNPEGLKNKTGTRVESSVNMEGEWQGTDQAVLQGYGDRDNLSDLLGRRLLSIRYSLGIKRGNQLQLRVTNDQKDEGVELSKVRYQVGGLSIKGTTEATASRNQARSRS